MPDITGARANLACNDVGAGNRYDVGAGIDLDAFDERRSHPVDDVVRNQRCEDLPA